MSDVTLCTVPLYLTRQYQTRVTVVGQFSINRLIDYTCIRPKKPAYKKEHKQCLHECHMKVETLQKNKNT